MEGNPMTLALVYAWDIIQKAMLVALVLLAARFVLGHRGYREHRHFSLWAREMQEV